MTFILDICCTISHVQTLREGNCCRTEWKNSTSSGRQEISSAEMDGVYALLQVCYLN